MKDVIALLERVVLEGAWQVRVGQALEDQEASYDPRSRD
jgi:hypothetical protein